MLIGSAAVWRPGLLAFLFIYLFYTFGFGITGSLRVRFISQSDVNMEIQFKLNLHMDPFQIFFFF